MTVTPIKESARIFGLRRVRKAHQPHLHPTTREFGYPDGLNSRRTLNALTKTVKMGKRRGERHPERALPKTRAKTQTFKDFRYRTLLFLFSTHAISQTTPYALHKQAPQRVRSAADVSPPNCAGSFRVHVREVEPDRGGFVRSCVPRSRYADRGYRRAQETQTRRGKAWVSYHRSEGDNRPHGLST